MLNRTTIVKPLTPKQAAIKLVSKDTSLGYQLWEASNNWQRKIRQALLPLKLTHVQYLLLAGMHQLQADNQQRCINQNLLAAHTSTDKMMTSKVIRTLETKDLIVRETSDTDGRSVLLKLTNKGIKLVQKASRLVEEVDDSYFEPVDKKRDKLSRYLQQLVELQDQQLTTT